MAEGVWDFVGQNQNELSFSKGEKLVILEQNGDWWSALHLTIYNNLT